MPIEIPEKVEINITDTNVSVKGEKGNLTFDYSPEVSVKKDENTVVVSPNNEDAHALWGTTRSIIANMIHWVSEWYTKSLEINGVGYKFEVQWQKLILSIGYSHKVDMEVPQDIKVTQDEKAKNVIHVAGIDKQKVGQFASKIKAKKKPEPYKWKGIKYLGEHIRRKAGKTGAK